MAVTKFGLRNIKLPIDICSTRW